MLPLPSALDGTSHFSRPCFLGMGPILMALGHMPAEISRLHGATNTFRPGPSSSREGICELNAGTAPGSHSWAAQTQIFCLLRFTFPLSSPRPQGLACLQAHNGHSLPPVLLPYLTEQLHPVQPRLPRTDLNSGVISQLDRLPSPLDWWHLPVIFGFFFFFFVDTFYLQ